MTKILSQSEVAAIRERAAKATPGPWSEVRHMRNLGGSVSYAIEGYRGHEVLSAIKELDATWPHIEWAEGVLEFIIASRADVPALCDTVDALRAKLEVAKAELQGIAEYWNGAPESAVDAIETVADRAHNCLAQLDALTTTYESASAPKLDDGIRRCGDCDAPIGECECN